MRNLYLEVFFDAFGQFLDAFMDVSLIALDQSKVSKKASKNYREDILVLYLNVKYFNSGAI